MGTFLAIVFVSIGAVFIKSIIRDVQRDQSRQARSAERRRRTTARAAAHPPPAAAVSPAGTSDAGSLVDDIGEAVVDGIVDADHGNDGANDSIGRLVASSGRAGSHRVDEVDDHSDADHIEADPVEAEDEDDVEDDDVDDADDDDDDSDSSDSGASWSWDDD